MFGDFLKKHYSGAGSIDLMIYALINTCLQQLLDCI